MFEYLIERDIDSPEMIKECKEYATEFLGYSLNDKIYGFCEDDMGYCGDPRTNEFWGNQGACYKELQEDQTAYVEPETSDAPKFYIIAYPDELKTVQKFSAKLLRP